MSTVTTTTTTPAYFEGGAGSGAPPSISISLAGTSEEAFARAERLLGCVPPDVATELGLVVVAMECGHWRSAERKERFRGMCAPTRETLLRLVAMVEHRRKFPGAPPSEPGMAFWTRYLCPNLNAHSMGATQKMWAEATADADLLVVLDDKVDADPREDKLHAPLLACARKAGTARFVLSADSFQQLRDSERSSQNLPQIWRDILELARTTREWREVVVRETVKAAGMAEDCGVWPSDVLGPRPPRSWLAALTAELAATYWQGRAEFLRREEASLARRKAEEDNKAPNNKRRRAGGGAGGGAAGRDDNNNEESAPKVVLPEVNLRLSCFSATRPPNAVRLVWIGQDPYPKAGNPDGKCFSIFPRDDQSEWPGSLKTILEEMIDDPDMIRDEGRGFLVEEARGSLLPVCEQGGLLINANLTVREGEPNSHASISGWDLLTDAAVQVVSRESDFCVFFLWGREAQKRAKFIDESKHVVLRCGHPSPVKGGEGFITCRHFSICNRELAKRGYRPFLF